MIETSAELTKLRANPKLRRDLASCIGLLVLGFCIHGWIDSTLISRFAMSMPAAQAANLGGLLAGAVAVAVGTTLGWICGSWLIEAGRARSIEDSGRGQTLWGKFGRWSEAYPSSRFLLCGGLASLSGAILGYWMFLGSLIMITAVSMGYWGRVMVSRQCK